ncbi:MAG TPA: hypothetical protein PLX89_26130 [Verrucomicrobiota bacterium]|nr:hypothetical protein [Verrucomicrobiales bacterium]HRI16488.1 hypothetical protein [Verrucomicrobiota bacterium]
MPESEVVAVLFRDDLHKRGPVRLNPAGVVGRTELRKFVKKMAKETSGAVEHLILQLLVSEQVMQSLSHRRLREELVERPHDL